MKLRPLTSDEYEVYVEKAIKNYEDELLTSGMFSKELAKQQSEATFKRLLPDGINTKDNYLFYAYDKDTLVGFIWCCMRGEDAFVYDFYINEEMRRKGYGKQVMLACEEDAKNKGAKTMSLHVFGHNKAARALYESIGYYPTSIQMRKKLF